MAHMCVCMYVCVCMCVCRRLNRILSGSLSDRSVYVCILSVDMMCMCVYVFVYVLIFSVDMMCMCVCVYM